MAFETTLYAEDGPVGDQGVARLPDRADGTDPPGRAGYAGPAVRGVPSHHADPEAIAAAVAVFERVGLAVAACADVRLGLGYKDGPIERVFRGGLATHDDISRALLDAYGQPGHAPARRVAAARRDRA